MTLATFAFSARGRINRARYWGGSIGIMVVYALAFVPFFLLPKPGDNLSDLTAAHIVVIAVSVVATPVFVWASVCLAIKRLHDRNKTGWWYLIAFVPYIGGLWLLVDCGILRGTSGPNRFGPDPLGGYSEAVGRVFEG